MFTIRIGGNPSVGNGIVSSAAARHGVRCVDMGTQEMCLSESDAALVVDPFDMGGVRSSIHKMRQLIKHQNKLTCKTLNVKAIIKFIAKHNVKTLYLVLYMGDDAKYSHFLKLFTKLLFSRLPADACNESIQFSCYTKEICSSRCNNCGKLLCGKYKKFSSLGNCDECEVSISKFIDEMLSNTMQCDEFAGAFDS